VADSTSDWFPVPMVADCLEVWFTEELIGYLPERLTRSLIGSLYCWIDDCLEAWLTDRLIGYLSERLPD
jgi:hypothetical protein